MSDTPDTDVYWDQVCDTAARWDVNEGHTKLLQYASRLERERDAERALADRLAVLVQRHRDGYGGQSVDAVCDCSGCEYLRPIDEALTAWKEARSE